MCRFGSGCVALKIRGPQIRSVNRVLPLTFTLDLAFALDAAEGIEVAVLNPKVANRFAQTIRRSKTDAADAEVLAEYTHWMPFTAWIAPSASSMRLRARLFGTSRPFLFRALRIRTVFTRHTAPLPHPDALFRI